MQNMFDRRLRELLKENDMTQKELARRIGVSQSSITYWVNGVKQPTAENIYAVAKAFETTADYLLGLSDY